MWGAIGGDLENEAKQATFMSSAPDPDYQPTLFAAPSIPLAGQLRPLILGWEVSEVALEVQTGEKGNNLPDISLLFVCLKPK